MVRVLFAIIAGLIGAAAVHIVAIFAIPELAENNAWGRLARIAEINLVARIDSLSGEAAASTDKPGVHDFAFIDPSFVTAACRFSLGEGPVRLLANGRIDFWSASIYSRSGDNLYSINDRSAVEGQLNLLVATPEQLTEAGTSDERDETAIPVGVDIDEGYLTLRILVDEESKRPEVDAFVRSLTCDPVPPPSDE